MKKYVLLIFVFLPVILYAQESQQPQGERVRLSGQVMLMSATNSNLTGGYYSLSPAVRGQVTASYRYFAFTVMRNSDLLDAKTPANLTFLAPTYARTFGAYTMTLTAETYLFDQRRDLDLTAPSLSLIRKGAVNLEALVLYGFSYEGKDAFSQRFAISKDYAGYTFKLTGWNVYWGTHRAALAAEISTKLTDRFRLTVIGNLNHIYDTETTQKFGVVRIAYAF
jgi:hypothetical protein